MQSAVNSFLANKFSVNVSKNQFWGHAESPSKAIHSGCPRFRLMALDFHVKETLHSSGDGNESLKHS